MFNVSFCANLVVKDNLFKNLPEGTPEGYVENLVDGYKRFLDIPVMQKITENDTIELSREKYRPGFALGIKYISEKFKEPIESGIYTNKKIPTVKPGELIFDTMTYIIIKSGIQQKFSKRHKENFLDAVKELLKQSKQN